MPLAGYSRQATRADFDAETAALVRRDVDARRHAERYGEPVRDPHVVLFADGCASWLTYRNRPEAERYLARLVEEDPTRWDGVTLVPFERHPDGRTTNRDTGAELPSYSTCPLDAPGGPGHLPGSIRVAYDPNAPRSLPR